MVSNGGNDRDVHTEKLIVIVAVYDGVAFYNKDNSELEC